MALDRSEREATLAEPLVGVLSIGRDAAGRGPLSVPLWYALDSPERLWFLTGASSVKARALAVGTLVSLCVQRTSPTVRYVTVEARVASVRPEQAGESETLAGRYLHGDALAGYLEIAPSLGPQVRVDLDVEHWLSADLGSFG